ncbi:hypothetical protein ACWBC2_16090 [Salegentibacter agarivorans]
MKFLKITFLALTVLLSFNSCSKDDDTENQTNGVYISINNDLRTPSLSSKPYYEIDLSSFSFGSTYYEPAGIQFVMDIYDPNREYIGGIGGVTSCSELEVYVDVFKQDFSQSSTVNTVFNAHSLDKEEKRDKAEIFIRFRDDDDDVILAGTALENQTVKIEQKNGEYYVHFENINFLGTDGNSTFKASGRIITN